MSIKKLLLGLAVSGQVACGSAAGNENKHEAEGSQEAVEGSNAATDVFGVRTQVQERQTEIIAEAEALAEIEQSAWQKVVEATPEMVERDRVEELWTNPTPSF